MLSEITAAELAEWIAYAELEPFGPLHDSRRAAVVAMASLAPWQEKGQQAKAADLFPELAVEKSRDMENWFTGEDMVLAGKMLTMLHGGEVK